MKKYLKFLGGLMLALLLLTGCASDGPGASTDRTPSQSIAKKVKDATTSHGATAQAPADIDYGSLSDEQPTESLASSTLSPAVTAALGGTVAYNGAGAFVVAGNQPDIATDATSPTYSEPALTDSRQLSAGVAVVDATTYQGASRDATTSDGKSNAATIDPPGWMQQRLTGSPYSELYNRGHSLGYAMMGKMKNFDASEANPDNISTQTAWANQADGGKQGDGQNYFEGIVRDAIKAHETLKYEVKPIYDGADLLPAGSEIEAQGIGNDISFNVFVPNVEPGVAIDYATGAATVVGTSSQSHSAPSRSGQAPSQASDSQRTVYVASHGRSKAYWYDETDMPASTNRDNVVAMTEQQALNQGKHHSEDE